MFYKNKIARTLGFILLTIAFSACNESTGYHLLYPIEASKQEVLRIQGYRFLSSTLDSPASILVLSNPIENGGFADFALSITNNSNNTLHLSGKDLVIKMSKYGELEMLSNEKYTSAQTYTKPKGYERLSPKMQAFGCAATNTKDNIKTSSFNASQSWVWDKHLLYPFKKEKLYLKTLDIPAGETKGTIFRVHFPLLAEDFKQATVLVHLKVKNHEEYRFKFILQSLQ
jgi:hypothetical protein